MSRLRVALPLAALVAACSQEAAKPPAPTVPNAVPQASKPASLSLGEPISAASVALTDIAKNPRSYEGRAVATSGVVTAVCQNMGCWMEIEDQASSAHIRMHGHSFFIPKSASGRHARVQATVIPKVDAKECDESPPHADPSKALARVELDATGVELD